MFFLPTFAPVGDTRQKPEWFWLILNHLRIFYYYERKIDACGAAGRGLRCTESKSENGQLTICFIDSRLLELVFLLLTG